MTGRTIAHYKILEKLGEGGMGVVYRALDTHLDRSVAIKVLRPEAVANPERKRRFVQEAKAASALNHPNILHIYDIDQSDGTDFIAMEYVPGKTLDQWIGRKGLSLGETLKYSVQIADALARAHAAGIVHRDLKPANLMVDEHGLVKLLDFGLAKLTETIEGDEFAPTETLKGPHTEEGTIVGTVAYMSPEQAEGKKVDARSDIFSFGSVLYEMVTGRRAFQGQTKISTLSAILHKEPLPIEGVPPELEKIIARCLRKEPERRSHHMDDVKLALQELKEESESGLLAVPVPLPRRRPWLPAALIIVGIVLAAVAGAWIWRLARAPEPAPAPVLTRLTPDSGLTTDPAVSSDGKLLAYASDRGGEGNLDIWIQHVAGGEPTRLVRHNADLREPAFSPDGTSIAFRSERRAPSGVPSGPGGIYIVSTLGGEPRRIVAEGRRPRFSPDSTQICYWVGVQGGHPGTVAAGKIYTIASAGGQPRHLAPEFLVASHPIWLPHGNGLLFLGRRDPTGTPVEAFDWWVVPLDGRPAKATGVSAALRRHNLSALPRTTMWSAEAQFIPETWLARSSSVLFTGSLGDSANLWEIPLSPKEWQVAGPPRQLTFGTAVDVQPSVAPGPGGITRLIFASLVGSIDVWSLPLDANRGKAVGEMRRLTQDASSAISPDLSPDGRRLVFVSRRSGNPDIWLKNLETGRETALTVTPELEWIPVIRPDGTKVAYQVYEGEKYRGKYPIFMVDAGPGGSGVPTKVCDDCGLPGSWTPGGTAILYMSWATPPQHIGLLELASGRKSQLVKHSSNTVWRPQLSADGGWIAFQATLGDERSRIFAAPFRAGRPVAEGEWIRITEGERDSWPAWSPDGNLLYFISERDGFRCIWARRLDPAAKRPVGELIALYHAHNARRSLGNVPLVPLRISVARDKIAFTLGDLTGNIWMAEWKER